MASRGRRPSAATANAVGGLGDFDHLAPATSVRTDQRPWLPLDPLVDFTKETRLRDRLFIPCLLNPRLPLLPCLMINRFYFSAAFLNLPGGIVTGIYSTPHLLEQLWQRHRRIGRNGHVHQQKPHGATHPALQACE